MYLHLAVIYIDNEDLSLSLSLLFSKFQIPYVLSMYLLAEDIISSVRQRYGENWSLERASLKSGATPRPLLLHPPFFTTFSLGRSWISVHRLFLSLSLSLELGSLTLLLACLGRV